MSVIVRPQTQFQPSTLNQIEAENQVQRLKDAVSNLEEILKKIETSLTEKNRLFAEREEILSATILQGKEIEKIEARTKKLQEDKKYAYQKLQTKVFELELLNQREIATRELYYNFLRNTIEPEINLYFLNKEMKVKGLKEKIGWIQQNLSSHSSTEKKIKNVIKKAEESSEAFDKTTQNTIDALERNINEFRANFLMRLFNSPESILKRMEAAKASSTK